MRSVDHRSLAALAQRVPFGTPKRLASFPRLHPATKRRLSSTHVCFCNRRAMACVILNSDNRTDAQPLVQFKSFGSVDHTIIKVNRTGLEKSHTGLKIHGYAR